MTIFFRARLEAYAYFYDCYAEYIKDVNNPEKYATLLNSISKARLVSSERTSTILEELAPLFGKIAPDTAPDNDINSLRGELLLSMQNDLRTFSTPSVK